MACNSMSATLLQGQTKRRCGLPCVEPVSQAAASMDAPLHISMKPHQQGRLLRQGMRSKSSPLGPASQDTDDIHFVNDYPCAAARKDLHSWKNSGLACPMQMTSV